MKPGKSLRVSAAARASPTIRPARCNTASNLGGSVEAILRGCGYELTPVADSHLCCGAAGTYTLTQPALSRRLLDNKLDALQKGNPEVIVTANVGCQMHLAGASNVPVRHWIELLDRDVAHSN